tara:strand:+ start:2427 stop:3059 length:633 start_codon:yes stop_codon:yes gene_type:complete
MNPKVDQYLFSITTWKKELEALRSILLDCGLTEEFKWKQPCYTHQDKNIVILANFKNHCAIGFFKGAYLADEKKLLTKPGEHSQEGRQFRFTSIIEITRLEATIKSYLFEAIEVEKAGIKNSTPPDLAPPREVQDFFDEHPKIEEAFKALTPGRQRAYNIFFIAAKQSSTRLKRVEKYADQILNGFGLNDCTCGMSKRMPGCDGSHKYLK